MKSIIIRLSAVLAVLVVLSSCIKETFPKSSSLTDTQLGQMDSSIVLSAMVNGIPAAMMSAGTSGYYSTYGFQGDYGIGSIHTMTEYMLEDLTVMGEMGYCWFNGYYQNLAQGSDYYLCAYFWQSYYRWILLANRIILMAGNITENTNETVRDFAGQAYAYRAMFYLDLARLFEPKDNLYAPVPEDIKRLTVPIVTETTSEDATRENPRVSRDEIYEFILSDLKKAEEYLNPSVTNYDRPTLAAVYGLYARLYLELGYTDDEVNAEYNQLALDYADKAITASARTPLTEVEWTDPSTGFNDGSANNSWIWGLTLSSENAGNLMNFTSHMSPEAVFGYASGCLPAINKALYNKIPSDDFRKKSWLDPDGTWNPYESTYVADNGYRFAGGDDPISGMESYGVTNAFQYFALTTASYAGIKFRPAGGVCVDYTVGACADHMLMRVEEMHFIKMEATLRLGKLTDARNLLRDFMQTWRYSSYECDALTASESSFLKEMMLQKRIEFWGEGILIYDYKRLNHGITRGYPGTNVPTTATFNCEGRSPQWNLVITLGEFQSNLAITKENNNPDPTGTIPLWTE